MWREIKVLLVDDDAQRRHDLKVILDFLGEEAIVAQTTDWRREVEGKIEDSTEISAVLLGDSCHALTPFFGQGCNCAFEDVRSLDRIMSDVSGEGQPVPVDRMGEVLERYEHDRKPNGDAIQRLALDNYAEMSDRTADETFLLKKKVEIHLARAFPLSCMV